MEKYKCAKCEDEKPVEDFNKCKSRETGVQPKCRDCEKEYRQQNREKIKLRMKKYRLTRLEDEKINRQQYYQENKLTLAQKSKKYNEINKDTIKLKKQKYYLENKERIAESHKNYRLNNLEEYRKYQREWTKNKRKTDPHYLTQHRLRNRLNIAIKKGKGQKLASMIDLVGCSLEELKIYLESLFTEGMSWEELHNGNIEIDHIKPCCKFDFNDLEQQKKCFHYTNLRPLWKPDNKKKISADLKQSIRLNNQRPDDIDFL